MGFCRTSPPCWRRLGCTHSPSTCGPWPLGDIDRWEISNGMEWKVRFIDYPAQYRRIEDELMRTLKDVLSGGDLILRKHVREFEEHLAGFVGARYAVGVSNC